MSTLARATGRGAVVNLGFAAVVQGLALVQGVLVPRLLGPSAVGLFALAMGGVAVGRALKEFGIPKKLVEERDVDLHTSYNVAFTLEVLLATLFFVVVLGVAPLLAWIYHRPELWLLTSLLGLQLFTTAFLELPAAIPYRQMRFVRRNLLQAVGPLTTFAVTVPFALLGFGIWSLAAGTLAGFVAACATMLLASPQRPTLTWDRPLVRAYLRFGWPLWLGMLVTTAAGWGAVFVVSGTIGVVGLGFFQLAHGWGQRALVVHVLLADTLFPALVTMRSSAERLRRAFVMSNQLAMLFSAIVGFGMIVFARPVVEMLLGPTWSPSTVLVQAQGVAVVIGSIGFNWDSFLLAAGRTRPQLVVSVVGSLWVVVVALPLLAWRGIDGGAAAIVIGAVASHVVRQRSLRPVIGRISFFRIVRAQLAAVGAVAVAVAGLQVRWTIDSVLALVVQAVAFVVLATAAGAAVTLGPVRELRDALRRRPVPPAPTASSADAPPWRLHDLPRPQAFPLGIRTDTGAVWVTCRDWPALGRFDTVTDAWAWTAAPPYPHLPTPDGEGGCHSALTRSSALVHLDRRGELWTVPLPPTRELLATARVGNELWAVDAGRRCLWCVVPGGEPLRVDLPDVFRRPDIAVPGPDGTLLVADTSAPVLGVVDGATVTTVPLPHPTRWVLADRDGVWLGASGRPLLTRCDRLGDIVVQVELPDAPFDLAALDHQRVVAAVKDADVLAVVDLEGRCNGFPLPPGSAPIGIAIDDQHAWVTLALASQVAQIDREVLEATLPARPRQTTVEVGP